MAVSNEREFHFSTEVRVRLPETDAMGVVFHGNYFTYLEVGRVDYLLNLGLTEGNRPIRDFDNVVVSAHLDFRSPARLHDVLKIEVRVAEIRTASIRFARWQREVKPSWVGEAEQSSVKNRGQNLVRHML